MNRCRSTVLFLALQLTIAFSQRTSQTVLKELLQNYDPLIRPDETKAPVRVTTNMYLRSASVIDEDFNTVEMQITFRTQWNDTRLKYRSVNPFAPGNWISLTNPKAIWTPDIFFSNAKSGYRIGVLQPNTLIRIYPTGNVLYSNRIVVQLSCIAEPERYPLDKVLCPIVIASYGLTMDDEHLEWKSGDPLQFTKKLRFENFRLTHVVTSTCNAKAITGEYACLKAELYLERNAFSTYFFYLYLPSLGLVLLSWLTFFIGRKASEIIRLTLTLTFTLLMVLTCTSLWHIRPHYGYITPADTWVFVSSIFVFYAMLHYVGTRFMPCLSCFSGSSGSDSETAKTNEPFLKVEEKELKSKNRSKRLKRFFKNNKADIVARLAYPVCYIIFVIIYCTTYRLK